MSELNPGIPPFKCAFCETEAVCGLRQKSQPELVINVCAEHYREKTGKAWKSEEVQA